MSLTAVARRVRGARALGRTVLVVLAIIAGLLAMHSLNTHGTAMGHGAAVMASEVPHQGHHDTMAAAADEGIAPVADHSLAWMACVLALLGAVIVFVAATGNRLAGARARLLSAVRARWAVVAHALPPPSLTVLCIRRT